MTESTILSEVRDALMITWEDEQTDRTLLEFIDSSKVFFLETVSDQLLFERGSRERELLIERVRYRYNNALDDFIKNYRSDLATLIQLEAVKEFQKKQVSNGTN